MSATASPAPRDDQTSGNQISDDQPSGDRPRGGLVALCITQTTSWGVLFYSLPAALTPIAEDTGWSHTAITGALSIGLILMVISEMFASSSGLGFTIVQFQRSFAVPEMWSGIVVLGLIGVILSFIFQAVQRRVLRWYHGLKEVENAV